MESHGTGDQSAAPPFVLLESYDPGRAPASYRFGDFWAARVAHRPEQVVPVLHQVERAVEEGGHAVGYLSYEAAAGLDANLTVGPAGPWPLVWFGLFGRRERVEAGVALEGGSYTVGEWKPSLERGEYDGALDRIRRFIADGDTYQVNYTLRLESNFRGDVQGLYADLCRSQKAAYCALFDWGDWALLSASPELFFALDGDRIICRPMKGTRPRGRWLSEDEALARQLQTAAKDRAENAMIVDLLRNDLGRVARTGTVRVPAMWEVERYETVWQLTSTVEAHLQAGLSLVELFRALFPCGSVTGAPKVRTMQLIGQLEPSHRGPYTGCIGFISPGRQACFNVAIRTAWVDRRAGRAQFGVGSGITWDSSAADEYAECLVKTRVLTARRPRFDLLETLLWNTGGYYLVERHLQRLGDSAQYFGFAWDDNRVRQELAVLGASLKGGPQRVRLLLGEGGHTRLESQALDVGQGLLRVALCTRAVDRADPFLYHKTTHRQVYRQCLGQHPACDDVILVNDQGQLTQCCMGNLVVELEGRLWTPPRACGLLAGTFRAEMLDQGLIEERCIGVEELAAAGRLYRINSVRGWMPLELARA